MPKAWRYRLGKDSAGRTITSHDLTGYVFGRLVVERSDGRIRSARAFVCLCTCGNRIRVRGVTLTNGNTRSCGCLMRDLASARHFVHGHKGNYRKWIRPTPEHNAWRGMIDRCENADSAFYASYGGRGITVCAAWRTSFASFLADAGARPGVGYSIDRVDVNGNYEPGNIRWATSKEQCRDKRNNVIVTLAGQSMTRAEAAERIGWPYIRLRDRLRDLGTTCVDLVLGHAS